MRPRILGLGAALALAPFLCAVERSGPIDLAAKLEPIRQRHGLPALGAVVLRGDRIVAEGVTGIRRLGSSTPTPATIADRFEIASCAKAFTTTVVGQLVEEGKTTWDTTLYELFRAHVTDIDPAWKAATLRQALAHSAGLKDRPFAFRSATRQPGATASQQRLAYLRKILARPPAYHPGSQVVYGSSGSLLAAAVIEQLTGETWEHALAQRLFRPLGMSSAGFGPPGSPGLADQPWGHGRRRWLHAIPLPGRSNLAFDPASPGADFPRAAAPAGLVHVSLHDWAHFASLHLRAHQANPKRHVAFLQSATFEALHTAPAETLDFALGWQVGTRSWARGSRAADTGRVLFHLGDNGRWNTAAWLAPERDAAILIVTNRGGSWRAVDQAAGALIGVLAQLRDSE
ncbi:MAG TPA: serine hydrolase domain-containing protein [Opitutus sp.]|nr:serine hydrolase domain-containing protein [Opitutus sp.]